MDFETTTLDNGIILTRLIGRLDMQGTMAIENKFTFAVASQENRIVVDLGALEFIASIGVRMLVKNAKSQAARGGKLVLANAQPQVAEILQGAGIAQLIDIYDDVDAAVAAFTAPA